VPQKKNSLLFDANSSIKMVDPNNGEESAVVPTGTENQNADDTDVVAEVDPSQQVFKNLIILPPLQKDEGSKDRSKRELADGVPLPPIRAEEPVSSIRAALGEVRGYAHLTNYRFVLENNDGKDTAAGSSGKRGSPSSSGQVVSSYTGINAAISTKEVVKSFLNEIDPTTTATTQTDAEKALVLDEFGDLTSLLCDGDDDDGLKDGSGFRIVLERYDIALIRDHIARLRTLLDGNAPNSVSLDESGGEVVTPDSTPPPPNGSEKESDTNASDGSAGKESQEENSTAEEKDSSPDNNKEGQQKPVKQTPKKDTPAVPPKDMPVFSPEKSLSPDINDLKKFFYYACGEDPSLYLDDSDDNKKEKGAGGGAKSKKKGKKKNSKTLAEQGDKVDGAEGKSKDQLMKRIIPLLNQIEERTRISCNIRFSGFHPPPQFRQFMGDLAYLEVTLPGGQMVSITATPLGFFVNRSSLTREDYKFNPSPAETPCFSHELLDCLLQYSKSFSDAWSDALVAAKTRAELMLKINADGPFHSFFRVAIRGDFPGYKRPSVAAASEGIDALVQTPSWLVPIPRVEQEASNAWNRNCEHAYSSAKTEEDISNSFGVDIRNGSLRDWNEELQVAREMPMDNLLERIERARVLNKVLTDFGEAVVLGVKAISQGQVTPMNPNEPLRSQVFLHNNIFFSRAVDAGLETFKVAKGDKAARKSASRDLHCLGALHRMERTGLHTLATAVIDYLGSRFVCQSILPGILSGEKTHTLLYGAVESGVPLVWDKEMHDLFETTLGKGLMIATRPMPKQPLTPERIAEIEDAKIETLSIRYGKGDEEKKDEDESQTIDLCAPLEAKGIRGSDQRKYVLDMTRLTPRDANWVPKEKGGSGKWDNGSSPSSSGLIPESLNDEEWTLAVLRNELVSHFAQIKMAKYVQERKVSAEQEKKASAEADENAAAVEGDKKNATDESKDKPAEIDAAERKKMSEDDLAYLNSLRFNVNVFLPDIITLEGIDDDAFAQIKKDEEMVREAAVYLWDDVIPGVTIEIRMGTVHTVPHDGKSLTEFIHQRGINCRYLGRLAKLAQVEEEKDKKQMKGYKENKVLKLDRRKMPFFWLELLECEMVARASKHVLDRYLSVNNYANIGSLSQIVASFLCALVSEGEETAAQTEKRMGKAGNGDPDEDDLSGLTFFQTGASPCPQKTRHEVWSDIEEEIGRRFRYSLIIFNQASPNDRTPYLPLLRRVCQRNGIRLAAKSYDIGSKCICSDPGSGGSIIASYPISALDVVDIVPLMKHAAAHNEGFVACGVVPTTGLPPLHISLPDARATLEQAHLYHSKRLLSRALDLAQEAAGLYQRVSETPAHPGVVRCIDLIASILYDAGEPALAAQNAGKALGYQTQISGFDSPDVINLHFVMFQFLLATGEPSKAIKHIKAAIYLMQLIGGKNHLELSNAYHKAGTVYHGVNDLKTALRFYQEATAKDSCDRLLEAMISKSSALVLAGVGDFKQAVDNEKRAFQLFSVLLGTNHTLTKQSDLALNNFMRAAVEHGSRMVDDLKKKREEEAAEAIAFEIEAEEEAEEVRRKKKNQKKKKGKKH